MTTHHPHLLACDAVPADRLTVTAPFAGTPIATVDLMDGTAVDQALAVARQLYLQREGWLPGWQRLQILEDARRLMIRQAEQLALDAAREGGKPLGDSRVEVARAIDGMQWCIDALRSESGREVPMGLTAASAGRLAMTRREPIGVVVAISAFNHPLNLIVHQVGPALAAGCPVIVKPAPDAPLSCLRFIALLREAGLPAAWAQALLTVDHDTTAALACDPRVGFVSFIGSAQVGWRLRARLAPGTRCALEHGGVAPVLVSADADLDDTLPLLAKGGFYHAGQVCVSVQRVFVHHSIARQVADGLVAQASGMTVGDPLSGATDIGPLIRPAEVTRVHDWVQQAVAGGATCLCGGRPLSETCYPPTVLYDPPIDARVSREEIFGPVICVYPYDDIDQAIAQANDLPYAFQAAVFTRDLDTAMHAYRQLDASAVMCNDSTAFRVDWMPFAGRRQSGLGVGGIVHTYRDMQSDKLLVIRSPAL